MSERAQTMDEPKLSPEIEEVLEEARVWFVHSDSMSVREMFEGIARRVQAIERERCAKVAEHYAVGIMDSGDAECCGRNEQAWLISRSEEIAAAIREGK